ncbi:LysR substrate-binding domain-containing protein [Bradyrhizobium sacchari]|uniref:LysR substrate-binding domain-containing protein n=1 Tax=Bradyrhizobium sacchari TaxID=1399419 RepID=UPI0009AF53B0
MKAGVVSLTNAPEVCLTWHLASSSAAWSALPWNAHGRYCRLGPSQARVLAPGCTQEHRFLGPKSGAVRLATTEALGANWLGPRLVDFQSEHPQLRIDLQRSERSADIHWGEADISIQISWSTNPDAKIMRICRMHANRLLPHRISPSSRCREQPLNCGTIVWRFSARSRRSFPGCFRRTSSSAI